MMRGKFSKFTICILSAIALLFSFAAVAVSTPETAFANSAEMEFTENSPYELIPVKSEDVSVKSEILTFDTTFADEKSGSLAKITAEYVFENSGAAQNVTLGFPYVGYSYWYYDEDESIPGDFHDVAVSFNGNSLTPEKLFGKEYNSFTNLTFAEILEETNKLNVPKYDLPCTLYTFTKTGGGDDPVEVNFDYSYDEYVVAYSSTYDCSFSSGKAKLFFYEAPDYAMRLLIVGGSVTPEVIGGSFVAESMTFGRYLDDNELDRAYANTQLNAAIEAGRHADRLFTLEFDDFTQRLVLLKYDAEFQPGENRMTVSYYAKSSSNFAYEPTKYTFDYISLPAKEWAGFSDLTINVVTNSYVLESNVAFEKCDGGYTASCAALPEENISFTLCASENPKNICNRGMGLTILMIVVIAICFVAAAVVIGIIIYYTVKTSRIRSKY